MLKTAFDLLGNEFSTSEEADHFLKYHDAVIVGAFDSLEGDQYSAFSAAVHGGECKFCFVRNSNTAVLEHLGMGKCFRTRP